MKFKVFISYMNFKVFISDGVIYHLYGRCPVGLGSEAVEFSWEIVGRVAARVFKIPSITISCLRRDWCLCLWIIWGVEGRDDHLC